MQKTVLVVDDSMFMRNYLKSILSDNKYKIPAEASNGKDAISLYSKVKPSIVLLDFTLPDINGICVLKEIKKIDPSAKIVMCSAIGQKSVVIEALQHGALDFIVKPKFHQLIPTLNKIFNHSNL